MKKLLFITLTLILSLSAIQAQLKVGNPAPWFKGYDQNNNIIESKDYKGKKVVLYFYPKDNTPGCTAQACAFRDDYSELQSKGYNIIGVSDDDIKSHAAFAKEHNLNFPLIADTDKTIINSYGANGMLYTKRITFVINEKGIIEQIIEGVSASEHSKKILKK
ncbi:MAG: peroxiredoxin [Bacteroidales bacterium]